VRKRGRPVAWKPDTSPIQARQASRRRKRNRKKWIFFDESRYKRGSPYRALSPFVFQLLPGRSVLENLSNNVASAGASRDATARSRASYSVCFAAGIVVSEISKTLACSALNFNEDVSNILNSRRNARCRRSGRNGDRRTAIPASCDTFARHE